jgi:hypothetical protein
VPDLPAPLPPAERTVGQLVAETIRAYGGNFWRILPLGIPIAVSSQISLGYDPNVQTVVLFAFGPLIALAYVYACRLVHGARPTPVSYVAAVLVFAPVPLLERAAVLPAVAWLALFGLAPAAAMIEHLGFRASLDRGRRLDLVLTPLLYLGGALLYTDQAARVGSRRPHRRSPPDADLHPPVDADTTGRPDPQVES